MLLLHIQALRILLSHQSHFVPDVQPLYIADTLVLSTLSRHVDPSTNYDAMLAM